MEYVEEEFKLDIKEELVENDLSSSRVPIQKIKIEKYEPMNNLIEHNFEIEHVEEEFKLEIKEELVKSEFPFTRVPIQKIKIEKHEPVDDLIVADITYIKAEIKIEENIQQPRIEAVLCGEPAEILHDMENEDIEHEQEMATDESNDPEVDTDDVNEDFVKLKSKRLKRLKGPTRSTGLKPAYYTCTFCGKDFKTKKYFHVHVEVEHHGLRYKCVQHCGRLFKSVSNRNAHNCSGIKEEMNPDLFQCQHCDKSYYMKKYLDKHLEDHMQCTKCGKTFLEKMERGPRRPGCTVSGQVRNPRCSSCKNAERYGIICHYCKNRYKEQNGLFTHIDTIHLKSKYLCHKCTKAFTSTQAKKNHPCQGMTNDKQAQISKAEFKIRTKNTCNLCERTYDNHENYLEHFKYIHKERKEQRSKKKNQEKSTRESLLQSLQCILCDHRKGSKVMLLKHVEETHLEMTKGKGPHPCRKCANHYPNRKNLLKHISFCHKDKPFWYIQ